MHNFWRTSVVIFWNQKRHQFTHLLQNLIPFVNLTRISTSASTAPVTIKIKASPDRGSISYNEWNRHKAIYVQHVRTYILKHHACITRWVILFLQTYITLYIPFSLFHHLVNRMWLSVGILTVVQTVFNLHMFKVTKPMRIFRKDVDHK